MNKTNGYNQYRCHFCEKMCRNTNQKCSEFSKHARWHHCDTCDVFFAIGPASRVQGARFAAFDPNNEENIYTLTVNYKKKKTKINYLEKYKYNRSIDVSAISGNATGNIVVTGIGHLPPGCTFRTSSGQTFVVPPIKDYYIKELLSLDKAVKDVTPQNALDKIKMYILFS